MVRYLLRKVASWIVLVFLATNITYLLASWFLDPRANYLGRRPPLKPEQITSILRPLNLDPEVPIVERWWNWLQGVLFHWDWGKSPLGTSVQDEISFRIWVSAQLLLGATIISVLVGVGMGVFAASRQYSRADRFTQALSIVALNTHVVVASLLVVLAALKINKSAGKRLLYVTGSSDPTVTGFWPKLVDAAQHLILPSVALVIISYSGYYFLQRSLLLDNINADYVRTARAKGLTRPQAIRRHALRTSLIPVATSVAFSIPGIFTGAVLTETIFGWHGMGEYFIQTLSKNDVNGVVAVAAFGATMTAIGAILSDLFVVYLDPRVRVS